MRGIMSITGRGTILQNGGFGSEFVRNEIDSHIGIDYIFESKNRLHC